MIYRGYQIIKEGIYYRVYAPDGWNTWTVDTVKEAKTDIDSIEGDFYE